MSMADLDKMVANVDKMGEDEELSDLDDDDQDLLGELQVRVLPPSITMKMIRKISVECRGFSVALIKVSQLRKLMLSLFQLLHFLLTCFNWCLISGHRICPYLNFYSP